MIMFHLKIMKETSENFSNLFLRTRAENIGTSQPQTIPKRKQS